MKICILSHAYEPHPVSAITAYHNAAARILTAAGHEVHILTNLANHGSSAPRHTHRLWSDGKLTIHRLAHFDERGKLRPGSQFFDVVPQRYEGDGQPWAADPSNIAALQAATYLEQLHLDVGIDVVESPVSFAEAFYILRARCAGRRASFPPVCVHDHSRAASAMHGQAAASGSHPDRHRTLREDYCVQNADALLTSSPASVAHYRERFGRHLPELQRTIPPSLGEQASVAQKLELFQAMLEREAKCRTTLEDRFFLPPSLHPLDIPPPLPGKGVVVIDAAGAPADRFGATRASIDAELRGSPGYRVTVLLDADQRADAPVGWTTTTLSADEPPPWAGLDDDDTVVWALAGVRFDLGRLRDVARQLYDTHAPCGSFAWLRPASARVFPYSPDLGLEDLLCGAHTLPPAFAVKVRHLRAIASPWGLRSSPARLAVLLCAAAAGGLRIHHAGDVLGDFYGDVPLMTSEVRAGAIAFLERCKLVPRGAPAIGDLLAPPTAPVASPPGADNGALAAGSTPPAAGGPALSPVADIATLERVYYEHMRLKQLGIVRLLRKLGIFDLARRIVPGSKKYFGLGGHQKPAR